MNYDLGYYTVNGQVFTDKIHAILEAQKTSAKIDWYFYKEKFEKANWLVEPELSIDTLYKLRAQQIRDTYDYVIVLCSGGADSTNAVCSFLNNGIHVDEVVSMIPESGLKNWEWSNTDTSVTNTISETKYALFPLLNEIAVKHPNVKITINDYFEDIINYKTDEWIYQSGDWISPVSATKGSLDKFKHLVDMAEQGKRIGVVWGVDKPSLRYIEGGDIIVSIHDRSVNVGRPPFKTPYPNVDRVLFYYAPDLPELIVKQCHMVSKYIHKKENLWISNLLKELSIYPTKKVITETNQFGLPKVDIIKNQPTSPKSKFFRAMNPILYPTTYDHSTFQCDKSSGGFMGLQHGWLYKLHSDSMAMQLLESDFKAFYSKINPIYLTTDRTGFAIHSMKFKIGSYKQFLDYETLH
jgi:hypothetical protein